MMDLNLATCTVAGAPLLLRDVLRSLHRRGRLLPLLKEAAAEQVLLQHAAREGLAVSDAELQQAADRFRHRHGLTGAGQTHQWLTREGLTVQDFEAGLERDLLLAKVEGHLTEPQVADRFNAHRDRYARARLRHIVVASEGTARELLAQVADEGRDFGELARAHSLDDASRQAGGSLGTVPRSALPAAIAEAVFRARPGAVVGPVATGRGFALFLVEDLLPADLDEATAALIGRELFDAWLAEQLRDFRIDLSWLETD
jgi:parvulin-like peptidyl-prolyl isomerase